MFEILAEIGDSGNGVLTGQYPPLREMLDVNPDESHQAMLDYSKNLPRDRVGDYTVCLLVQVAPDLLSEVLCSTHRSDASEPGKA